MTARTRNDSAQQAIMLVLGITLVMLLFSMILVSAVDQQAPQVNSTLINHATYRALQAGVSEFLYAINQDPNAAACGPITTGGVTKPSPSCNYFTSKNVSLNSWQLVPNQPSGGNASNYNPTEWVSIGYPTLQEAGKYIEVTVVGAAGFANSAKSIQYQTANITLNATNNFLLNVVWSNYNAIDTNSLDATLARIAPATCSYLWVNNDPNCSYYGSNSGLNNSSFPVYGPQYSNDEIITQGCPPMTQVTTYAPSLTYKYVNDNNSPTGQKLVPNTGCTGGQGAVFPPGAKNVTSYSGPHSPPTTLAAGAALSDAAKSGGCYYTGPTTITLVGTGGFTASSPETKLTGTGKDSYSLAGDTSTCPVDGTTPAILPTNGVIYVDSVPVPGGVCPYANAKNPLTAVYNGSQFPDGQLNNYSGETASPGCEGDVILHGSLSGALTIGVANNIVIDGNVTYHDCPSITATNPASGNSYQSDMNSAYPVAAWAQPCAISNKSVNDVLGLIANDYVELNLPFKKRPWRQGGGWTIYGACPIGTGALTCTDTNPIIMGSILALTHAFAVPNFNEAPGTIGEIDYYGSLAENFVDIEQSGPNGYGMDYNWDPRLAVLSPPHYLAPGTDAWATQSFSVTVGQCSSIWPVQISTCPTTASAGSTVP